MVGHALILNPLLMVMVGESLSVNLSLHSGLDTLLNRHWTEQVLFIFCTVNISIQGQVDRT